jgi:hypothetical protein
MECDFLQRAGVAVLPQFEPSIVGRTIADYMCSFCDGPMLRSPSGEGIAFVANDEPVHEECFNPAVDFGY